MELVEQPTAPVVVRAARSLHPHKDHECGREWQCTNPGCVEPETTWCKSAWCGGPDGVRQFGQDFLVKFPLWLRLASWALGPAYARYTRIR